MIHYPKQTNVSRYADFIKKFNGCEIDLTKEIELFRAKDGKGIGKGAKPWIAAGIAQKVGRKKYFIMPTDEHWQAATSILKLRRNVYPREYKKNQDAQVEMNEEQAINYLKSKGYKIFKPKVEFTEI